MTDAKGLSNVGFSVWVSICAIVCLWLWSTFAKGRRRFQTNLHVIEEGLRKMQADIDMRQREKSIGCVEDVEDISEFLRKFYEEGNKEKNQDIPEAVEAIEDEKKEMEKEDEVKEADVVEDKKSV